MSITPQVQVLESQATGWSDSYIHWQAIPGPLSLRPIQGTGNDYPLKNRNGVEPTTAEAKGNAETTFTRLQVQLRGPFRPY